MLSQMKFCLKAHVRDQPTLSKPELQTWGENVKTDSRSTFGSISLRSVVFLLSAPLIGQRVLGNSTVTSSGHDGSLSHQWDFENSYCEGHTA